MKHSYCCYFDRDIWNDLVSVKELDKTRSINSLINESVKKLVRERVVELSSYKQDRQSIRLASNNR